MSSSCSGGVEEIGERIAEIHQFIAKLKRPEEMKGPVLLLLITHYRRNGGK